MFNILLRQNYFATTGNDIQTIILALDLTRQEKIKVYLNYLDIVLIKGFKDD